MTGTRIVYASDGGAPALAAIDVMSAVLLRPATVEVVSVIDAPPIQRDEATRHAHEVAAAAGAALAAAGFEVATSTPSGHPGSETVHRAAADGADLIVVGAGNHRWLERVLLGSVSTRVLHTADTSVMVVHGPPASVAPAEVLLAVDGSHGATAARRTIVALLDPSGVRVTVEAVAAYAFPSFTGPGVGYATGGFTPAIEAELTAEAEREATTAAAWLRDAGFDATAVWEMGPAAATLLMRAAALPAALVVVGSRGLGPVDRAVLGSVSDELARHAGATLVAR